MTGITALILTKDEEANVERTVRALSGIKEVLVIDSFSSDRTIELAQAAHPNVRILQRRFDTHAGQWNFGLDNVTTEWVLTLDADYELSPELQQEIADLEPTNDVSGYYISFVYRIFGDNLRSTVYPPRVALFRTKLDRYVDEGHTQQLKIAGRTGHLRGKIFHDDRKPFSRWLAAQEKYSTIEARHLRELESRKIKGENVDLSVQDQLRLKIFFAAPAMFLYLLFGKGLILDGWPGWFYVCQRTIAELMLSIQLLIQKHRLEGSDAG